MDGVGDNDDDEYFIFTIFNGCLIDLCLIKLCDEMFLFNGGLFDELLRAIKDNLCDAGLLRFGLMKDLLFVGIECLSL